MTNEKGGLYPRMRLRMALLVMLIGLVPLAACEQTLESVKPGSVNIDLGDGYKASFTLGSSEKAYNIEVSTPSASEFTPGYKNYGFYIYPTGSEEKLISVSMTVSSQSSISYPSPVARREEDTGNGLYGVRTVTPMAIDGSIGYVGYDWQTGNSATDIKDAIDAFFHYYPGARKTSNGIETNVDIVAESNMLDKFPRSLPTFKELLNTLQISGSAIP